jgi:hypothetical protein
MLTAAALSVILGLSSVAGTGTSLGRSGKH